MSLHGAPGIGGSLGKCVVCGGAFAVEVFMAREVPIISIPAFESRDDRSDAEFCVHERCQETLRELRGQDWTALPEGPLRDLYAKAAQEREGAER